MKLIRKNHIGALCLTIIVMVILNLTLVSSAEFDNFKTYDKESRTYTITNFFGLGDEIAKVKLETELVHYVIQGNDRKVAELYFENYDDYLPVFNNMQFYDKNNNDKRFERDFTYKIKVVTGYRDIQNREAYDCDVKGENCKYRNTDLIREEIVEWIDFDKTKGLLKGNYTIGIFTDVYSGDYVEWIPTLFGERLTEFAVWTASLNQDIIAYYNFDEGGGINLLDNWNATHNGSLQNGVNWTTGKVGNGALRFQKLDDYINLTITSDIRNFAGGNVSANYTMTFWLNNTPPDIGDRFIFVRGHDPNFWGIHIVSSDTTLRVTRKNTDNSDISIVDFTDALNTTAKGTWVFYTLTFAGNNSADVNLYRDGILEARTISFDTLGTEGLGISSSASLNFSSKGIANTKFLNGTLDEIGIWNRVLTNQEILDIYNAGDGLEFSPLQFTPITISTSLELPPNNLVTLNSSLNFTGNFTSTNSNFTNATLILWDSSGTELLRNFTIINGTTNFSILSLSNIPRGLNHEWNYFACAVNISSTLCKTAINNRTLNITNFIINSRVFTNLTNEGVSERFEINITTALGLTISSSTLNYDGIDFTGTSINPSTDTFSISRTLIVPILTAGITNNSFFWKIITSDSFQQNSTIANQSVSPINLTLCGASPQNTPYINFTFHNETISEENVNATIISTWTYWLDDVKVNKTLSFSDATENPNYAFCFAPNDKTLNAATIINYNNAESQQRTFSAILLLTSAITTQKLFLLPTSAGLFAQFAVEDTIGNVLAGVQGTITRILSGNTIQIASALTDSSGFVNYFLNPDITYTGTFTKTGFVDNVFSFVPVTDLKLIIMGGTAVSNFTGGDIGINLTYSITPTNFSLQNNTDFTFTFNVSSPSTISLISMNITNNSGFQLLFQSNAGTGFLSGVVNTGNLSQIIGRYIIQEDDDTLTIGRLWIIGIEFVGDYSLFKQMSLYMAYDFQDFFRLVMVLFFIIAVLIFMSANETTDTSENKILVAILLVWVFSIVGWLDNPAVVSETGLAVFAKQYGIAILSSVIAFYFIARRLFIRRI